jgi:2-(3-amino-3-carboxypropyl)histidine synthase
VQFLDSLESIKSQIEKTKRKVSLIETNNAKYCGQILGCSKIKSMKNKSKNFDAIDAILYIGDGNFHPVQMKLEFPGKVFAYNPFSKKLTEIIDVDKYEKREKGMLLKFLTSKNIGIIISTKPGQRFGDINKLMKKYPDKKFYRFLFDTIDYHQLENFNFIDIWVNTACPRIGVEDAEENKLKIINIEKII